MPAIFNEVLLALIARLKTDATVAALVNDKIFSEVQQDTQFDYIRLSSSIAEFDTKGSDGFNSTITIDIFSNHAGNKRVNQISEAVYSSLHNQPLTLSVKSLCLQFVSYTTVLEPDNISTHGIMNFLHIYSN